MTPEPGPDEPLRAALARSAATYLPPPAPVDRILEQGRARRARRRAGYTAVTAAVLVVGAAVPMALHQGPAGRAASGPAATGTVHGTGAPTTPAGRTKSAAPADATPVTTEVRSGRTDGTDWSVTLVFYPRKPAGFPTARPMRGFTPPPKSSAICAHVVIGGVRVDHQGGRWSDCDEVNGAADPEEGDFFEGPWGLHGKGLSGTRVFVSSLRAAASGTVTLTDGTEVTGPSVTVPGTAYRAWAAPIPRGATIASVDSFDARGRRIAHQTNWH
ncbi:hypothetical protein [Streptomyces sp. NPDC020917]|uniref:hypothetical protein n=1 Tax=Streptomyces sp. NPDC020917 TaxID=3365102 RepID=UPI0037BC882D